jgi:hypothetical protein
LLFRLKKESAFELVARRFVFAVLGLTIAATRMAVSAEQSTQRGPVYVSLDSWIYPALKRLASLGYIPGEDGLSAPWTRRQCLLLVEEAENIAARRSIRVSAAALNREALRLIVALKTEFEHDDHSSASASVESVYSRYMRIAGPPLRDSYHFGQTIVNDFGRPYAQGNSTVDGFSAYGTLGRFSAYFRGEYQYAGGRDAYSQSITDFVARADGVPPTIAAALTPINKFDPLEMYVGARLGIFNVTFGKQNLWWGPGEDSAFNFSNNAEPFYAMHVAQALPIVLPGLFRFFGRIRTEFVVGKLSGHQYPSRPLMNAQKVTFQLTRDFDVGFTRSSLFGGVGHPLTTGSFFRSFFSAASTGGSAFGSANDPGDRRSGFDFVWRVPWLRHYLTIYSDSLADDEPNPLASPRRSAWGPGVYITQLPRLKHLDLRFETYSTWLYRGDAGGRFIYWNDQYRDAYTNNGNLLGSWVGRDARAYSASSTYWWSAQNTLTASFRQIKTGGNFLPGGGTQTDVSLTFQRELRPELMGKFFVQYERYWIPILGAPKRNVTANVELTFSPRNWAIRH